MPDLTLVDRKPDGIGFQRLTFDRPLEGFDHPGQFVTATVGDLKPAYFAIASVPGAPTELLVKTDGVVAQAIAALPVGAEVTLSEPIGNGFPMPAADDRDLVVLVTGSGLAGARAILESEVAAGVPRKVTVLYGVRSPDHASFTDRFGAWREAGIDLKLVVSGDAEGWKGDRGYVQHVVQQHDLVRPDTTVVLCGWPDMVEQCRVMWVEAGAEPEQLLVNF